MEKRRRRPALSDAEKQRIAELREAGMSAAKIGAIVGCSEGSVCWYCLQDGIDPPKLAGKPVRSTAGVMVMRRNGSILRRFTAEEDAEILRRAVAGESHTIIGRALGRRSNSVAGRLMTLGRHEQRGVVHAPTHAGG